MSLSISHSLLGAVLLLTLTGAQPVHAQDAQDAQDGKMTRRVNDLPRPATFTNFNDAVAHAKDEDKIIFIACTQKNHPASFKFAKMLKDNIIYLAADKVAVYTYEVEDDARLSTFKNHFKVSSGRAPIVIIADSWGKPLANKTGLADPDAYLAFVKATAGEEAIEIPPEGMFGVREGELVGSVDLTEMRTWTTVTGQKFTAALREAKGSVGIFRSESGKGLEVGFNLLSEEDIAFLKSKNVLQMK